MKKLLITILLAAMILPLAMQAELSKEAQPFYFKSEIESLMKVNDMDLPFGDYKSPVFEQLSPNYREVAMMEDARFSVLGNVTPAVYEPKSGFYFALRNTRFRTQADGDNSFGRLFLRYSANGGLSWQEVLVAQEEDVFMLLPSLNVANPGGEASLDAFRILITCPLYTPTGGGSYQASSTKIIGINGLDGFTGPNDVAINTSEAFLYTGPLATSLGFFTTQNFSTDENFYFYGTASERIEDGNQSGYAFGRIPTDFTDLQLVRPAAFQTNIWRPGDEPGTTYNGPMSMGADENGNIYVGFDNFLGQFNLDYRAPMFSKSTDNGVTWSELNEMPQTVFEDALYSFGWAGPSAQFAPQPGQYPYRGKGFAVTGEDQISMSFPVLIDRGEEQRYAMVEAAYDGNEWSLNLIADNLEGNALSYVQISNVGGIEPNTWKDSLSFYLRNEVQASVTQSGDALIVKYLDLQEDYIYDITGKNVVSMIGNEIYGTDVFMAVKDLTSNTWLPAVNVTNDVRNDKGTFIPNVVPDVSQISFFNTEIALFSELTTNTAYSRYNADYELTQFFVDQNRARYQFTSIDYNNPPKSVKENRLLQITEVYPNPASDIFNLSFKVVETGNVSIKLYDSMGRLITHLVQEEMIEGQQERLFNAKELNTGSYFINMVNGGVNATIPLQIVR